MPTQGVDSLPPANNSGIETDLAQDEEQGNPSTRPKTVKANPLQSSADGLDEHPAGDFELRTQPSEVDRPATCDWVRSHVGCDFGGRS